ncbi:hemoglobin/transferrin/lactoferrin receptor protein [Lewinella aquimaris]|uniref:Hemoglobin/transferrin/lactoferrin receptor protein n=1 Tax=Neolewinella aquimaris TaxID=1835722 RepID=A0A840E5L9_9BACT|nr:TonB-dependent receptor [Neolewinella aquimaris]MBB4080360.1 hemoglobin/transferrin/lactoferrin receptor protein [Neolewinella aquimaris]
MKWRWMALCLLYVQGAGAQVQGKSQEQQALMVDTSILLHSATVVGRRNEAATDLPYQIELIDAAAQRRVQSLTTADVLADLSGVYVQKSQLGGGSPVVRGFEANRVLLVVDGVRMNNAIYRNGHLQNAITVDPNVLERTEVIYGAGALAYGSDAIGGVIHFRTREPEFRPDGGLTGYATGNFASAANAVNLSTGLEYGRGKWAGLTSVSLNRFGDLRAGANRPDNYGDFGLRPNYVVGDEVVINEHPALQVGSGYEQYNLLQKLRFRPSDGLELSANFQYSTTGNVPRYDALTETRDGQLRWARWDYGPQTRLLGSLRLDDRRATQLYDLASYVVSYQFVEEDRIQRRLGDPTEEASLVDVASWNAQVDYTKGLNPMVRLRYGLDLRHERVDATAHPAEEPTRYPSRGSGLAGGGLYADLSRELGNWQLRGGLRYGYQRLTATFGADDPVEWPRAYLEGIVNPSAALTAALGTQYRRAGHGLRLLIAQGFRAPNVDDFAKFREQSGRIQVPNPELRPERSTTLEAAFSRFEGSLRYEATVYATLLEDAIIRRDGALPDGSPFFLSHGDTLFVDTNVNAERAWIYGFDLAAVWSFAPGWELRPEAHWLRGRRRQEAPDGTRLTLPQDHIPPAYGRVGLRYAAGPWETNLRLDFQLRKQLEDYAVNSISGTATSGYVFDIVGSADNPELTPYGTGTPGWWTVNLYGTYRYSDRLSVYLKGENLLDRFYQPFASGIAAPGIDVGIGARWTW